ncbi:dermokine-like [Onthophagus taurus]|uniref:dermokine-like n=1 Tax=Onthophagus taurus TaxID=166361 RepID=UPI0039BE688E
MRNIIVLLTFFIIFSCGHCGLYQTLLYFPLDYAPINTPGRFYGTPYRFQNGGFSGSNANSQSQGFGGFSNSNSGSKAGSLGGGSGFSKSQSSANSGSFSKNGASGSFSSSSSSSRSFAGNFGRFGQVQH